MQWAVHSTSWISPFSLSSCFSSLISRVELLQGAVPLCCCCSMYTTAAGWTISLPDTMWEGRPEDSWWGMHYQELCWAFSFPKWGHVMSKMYKCLLCAHTFVSLFYTRGGSCKITFSLWPLWSTFLPLLPSKTKHTDVRLLVLRDKTKLSVSMH